MSDTNESGSSSSSSSNNDDDGCSCKTCPQNILILLDGAFEEYQQYVEFHKERYMELHPHINIELEIIVSDNNNNNNDDDDDDSSDEVLAKRLNKARFGMATAEESDWDGVILPSQLVASQVHPLSFLDLTAYAKQSNVLDFTQVLPFFRRYVAGFGEQTRLIPIDGDVLSLYYRRDLFQLHGIQIPRTWDEYIAAAQFFHGKPWGPNNSTMYGSCISRIPNCANEYWTSLILSSITQLAGTSSGFLIDPETLDPLTGHAMEEVLRIVGKQIEVGHVNELDGECLDVHYALNRGECAMTYSWGTQLKDVPIEYDIGVAPTPGSQKVLDRTSEGLQLVNCTLELCPHGVYYDGIGVVNRAPYAAFGGWASGVSATAPQGRQYAAADFFAYMSNTEQSLDDVLQPNNNRTDFVQPYRYSHLNSVEWVETAGYDADLAWEYRESVLEINSENAVAELRIQNASALREILDSEVWEYTTFVRDNPLPSMQDEARTRIVKRIDERISESISPKEDDASLQHAYHRSIGYVEVTPQEANNYIDDNFRHAGWGLGGLICVTAITLIFWTIYNRNNRVMQAFQPFLLMQSAVGLLFIGATLIPIGFDDSLLEKEYLDVSCMSIPWMYIFGFTIFFSSVYSKIRECMKIYKAPHKYDFLRVDPMASLRLNGRLLLLNGSILTIWTLVDPLTWYRLKVVNGDTLADGTVETFGTCKGADVRSLLFAVIIFLVNISMCLIATVQAFKCRFIVLEYNEMQWIPLSLFPFVEVWIIGAPVVGLTYDDPTIIFIVGTCVIAGSTVAAALAVFAPKDWYIRKYKDSPENFDPALPQRTTSAGIRLLKHPTVESQKQLEVLHSDIEHIHASNTELEIEIRTIKDRFKELTSSERFAVVESLFAEGSETTPENYRDRVNVEEFDQTETIRSNDEGLAAMEQFQRVWKLPDDDDDEEEMEQQMSSRQPPGIAALMTRSRSSDDLIAGTRPHSPSLSMSTRSHGGFTHRIGVGSGPGSGPGTVGSVLPPTPESNSQSVSIFEDPDSRDGPPSGFSDHSVASSASTGQMPSIYGSTHSPVPHDHHGSNEEYPVTAAAYEKLSKYATTTTDRGRSSQMRFQSDDDDDSPALISTNSGSSAAAAGNAGGTMTTRSFDHSTDSSSGIEFFSDHGDRQVRINPPVPRRSDAILTNNVQIPLKMPDDEEDDHTNTERNEDQDSHSGTEGSDVVIRNKDMRELSSMIYDDDLEALMAKTSFLAESLKTKMADSQLVDMSNDDVIVGNAKPRRTITAISSSFYTDPVDGNDGDGTGTGTGLSQLDISKIGSDEDDDEERQKFVTVSDSILSTSLYSRDGNNVIPNRSNDNNINLLSPPINQSDDSNTSSSRSGNNLLLFAPEAGESSAAIDDIHGDGVDNDNDNNDVGYPSLEKPMTKRNDSTSSSVSGHTTNQIAGQPSQGDLQSQVDKTSTNIDATNAGWMQKRQQERQQKSPTKTNGYTTKSPDLFRNKSTVISSSSSTSPSTRSTTDNDNVNLSRSTSLSYSLAGGDWSAVGRTASVLADFSDSQSNSSYADSVSSLDATTRASALETPLAKEIDSLVAKFDFDGIKAAAKKYEIAKQQQLSSSSSPTSAAIEEKRRKKRELEAWRTSISKSYSNHSDRSNNKEQ